jgi:uncharacterized repeat protein (TIGR03803 family)
MLCGAVALAIGLCPSVDAQTFKVLHDFGGWIGADNEDGAIPEGGVTLDKHGNLYGTTVGGGPFNNNNCQGSGYRGCGTVFELVPNPDGSWSERLLYSFRGTSDYGYPNGPVVLDGAGNLYSTSNCIYDCASRYGGAVFELQHRSQGNWAELTLYDFGDANCISDPPYPRCAVALDPTGHLYGATSYKAFSLSQLSLFLWGESDIYRFSGAGGSDANALLTFDIDGNIYGATMYGGALDMGTVFRLTPTQGAKWTEAVLYSFQGGTDGAHPLRGVAFDGNGDLYGTTEDGGTAGAGTVFKLTPNPDGSWTESVLYSFSGGGDASPPFGPVTLDKAGNLYGTAQSGGAYGHGAIFKLSPTNGGQWKETIVHSFTGGSDGDTPLGTMVLDKAGNLYGTAQSGGAYQGGVAFEITQ